MAFPVAAAIAAGASLLSSGGQVYAQGKMNKKTRQWNEKMYGIQRADALADWELQNAYNSPEQQMERLRAAGLNPNLVYDNGATHTAGPVRSTEPKSWNPQTPNIAGLSSAAAEGIGAYQDWTLQQEQVKNMTAQRRNMDLDASLKVLQAAALGIKNSQGGLDLQKNMDLYDTAIATAEAKLRALDTGTDIKVNKEIRDAAMHAPNLAAALEKVANMSANTALAKQQLSNLQRTGVLQQMEIDMRKLGLSFNDSVILRMLAQFAEGKSLPELIKSAWNDLTNVAAEGGKDFISNDRNGKHSILGGMFSIDKIKLPDNFSRKRR